MKYYLYRITNTITSKVYIGQSIEPQRRWTKHKTATRAFIAGTNTNPQFIHKAMAKYGIENFVFEIIATSLSKEAAGAAEDELIRQYKSRDPKLGYNLMPGGKIKSGKDHPWWGRSHTEESKHKISDGMKKNQNGKTSPRMSGKAHTDKSKQKISDALKGNKNAKKPNKAHIKCHICKKIIRNATYCKLCVPRTKIDWPPKEKLLRMISDSNYESVARKLSVSSNAIRKRLAKLC